MQGNRIVYLWEINKLLSSETNFLHVTQESEWDKSTNQRVGTAHAIISSCHRDACMREERFLCLCLLQAAVVSKSCPEAHLTTVISKYCVFRLQMVEEFTHQWLPSPPLCACWTSTTTQNETLFHSADELWRLDVFCLHSTAHKHSVSVVEQTLTCWRRDLDVQTDLEDLSSKTHESRINIINVRLGVTQHLFEVARSSAR